MRTYKSVIDEGKDTFELKNIIEVYEETAAIKMQKIREEILMSREYYRSLGKLADEVGSDLQVVAAGAYQDAAVFLSANAGMYGDIIGKTFNLFLDFIKKNLVDLYVVGKEGEEMMRNYAPDFKFITLYLSDDTIEEDALGIVIKRLLEYRKVFLFYGKFQNIATQSAETMRVSPELLPKTEKNWQELKKKRLDYLYEPSVEAVSAVFAKEILSALMAQVFAEAQLAKFGSRLMFLDESLEKIDDRLADVLIEKRSLKKKLMDRKQNTMISGIMARE